MSKSTESEYCVLEIVHIWASFKTVLLLRSKELCNLSLKKIIKARTQAETAIKAGIQFLLH